MVLPLLPRLPLCIFNRRLKWFIMSLQTNKTKKLNHISYSKQKIASPSVHLSVCHAQTNPLDSEMACNVHFSPKNWKKLYIYLWIFYDFLLFKFSLLWIFKQTSLELILKTEKNIPKYLIVLLKVLRPKPKPKPLTGANQRTPWALPSSII